jgi:hypothetical protein
VAWKGVGLITIEPVFLGAIEDKLKIGFEPPVNIYFADNLRNKYSLRLFCCRLERDRDENEKTAPRLLILVRSADAGLSFFPQSHDHRSVSHYGILYHQDRCNLLKIKQKYLQKLLLIY